MLAIEHLTFEGRAFLDSLTKTMAKLKEFLPGELPEQKASKDFDDDLIRLYKKLEKFRLKLNTFYLERRRLSDALGELQRLLYAFLLK